LMPILERQGYFWWASESIPPNKIAPTSCVAGTFTLGHDGSGSLDLIGYLPNEHGPMAAAVATPPDKAIRGVLKESGEHVLLLSLQRNGGKASFGTAAISYERYRASICLVSQRTEAVPTSSAVSGLEIPLSGYEGWFWLPSPAAKLTPRTTSLKYKRPSDVKYELDYATLHFSNDVDLKESHEMYGATVSLQGAATARFEFRRPMALEDVRAEYELLEDLLFLLSTEDFSLDWPWITLSDQRCRLYFYRTRSRVGRKAPTYLDFVVAFPHLRKRFGKLWGKWRETRQALGAGAFLYLATRRGLQLYVEHRFASLVWGLESFDRKKHKPDEDVSEKVKGQIDRIISGIEAETDKKFAARAFELAGQPNLAERLSRSIRALPLDIERKKLNAFADRCAYLRNSLSHWGGPRKIDEEHGAFTQEAYEKGEALSLLYRLVLLIEIGFDAGRLKEWFYKRPGSFQREYSLFRAGLAADPRPAQPPKLRTKTVFAD
jgi:ApeA N-terminal domain 1